MRSLNGIVFGGSVIRGSQVAEVKVWEKAERGIGRVRCYPPWALAGQSHLAIASCFVISGVVLADGAACASTAKVGLLARS